MMMMMMIHRQIEVRTTGNISCQINCRPFSVQYYALTLQSGHHTLTQPNILTLIQSHIH